MQLISRIALLAFVLVLIAAPAIGQGTTGTLNGTVMHEGAPLPGVTITVSSSALQGTRVTYSNVNGDYNLPALPPGDYTVKFEMEGMTPAIRNVKVGVAQAARANATLQLSSIAEQITVTASAPSVMETTEVQTNFTQTEINELPLGRTVTAVALLAPGTTSNGPRSALVMSGSFASDNLILVNGANIQENLRGQAESLFIEDAIQETTVMTGSISAEYGRFTGGVISSITKSGGNEFSGSFRDSFDNPSWTNPSKADEPRADSTLNETYEATFGGRIIRDRLWFFAAGRSAERTTAGATFVNSSEQIFSDSKNDRWEGKLTGQITSKHSVVANYLDNPFSSTNNNQLGVYEQKALDPEIEQDNDFKAAHYSGIWTSNFLTEVNYSERGFTFVGFGGTNTDPYLGTPLRILVGGSGVANAPFFCGSCGDEFRDNQLLTIKGTYFVSSPTLGTHNFVAGVEDFSEQREANNYQSPTNLVIYIFNTPAVRNPDGTVTYTFGAGDEIDYWPVVYPSLGSDLQTQSVFLNDKWDLNDNFSFNIGARYDKNDAVDQAGNATSNDTAVSPRLAATYDIKGDGKYKINASYGKYVGRLAETVQGAGSAAGSPWDYYWYYDGEPIVGDSATVVKGVIDWFNSVGGIDVDLHPPDAVNIGGFSRRLDGKLKAPGMDEYSVGFATQIGNGFARLDYIDREWNNYYGNFTDLSTGQVTEPNTGARADLTLVRNTDLLYRNYKGVTLQGQYRIGNRISVGGNYTWSELRGNAEGEGTAGGPQADGGWILQYPEYQGFIQNRPEGFLPGDQTHKLRVWMATDFSFGRFGSLNVSLLQNLDSGTPYSYVGTISARPDPAAGADIGSRYLAEPTSVTYYFSDRGEFRWDDVTRTDLALNYQFPIAKANLFIEAELLNVFDEQAQISGNTAITTSTSTARNCKDGAGAAIRCIAFNPFSETPVLGTNYAIPSTFGTATSANQYQLPLTYRFSVGVRF
ncbi:MAG: TonB-dependent receptor [Acidobacteria bacterium]|nr:TonB-dependent receptor [Acidobacteriota bacterium]